MPLALQLWRKDKGRGGRWGVDGSVCECVSVMILCGEWIQALFAAWCYKHGDTDKSPGAWAYVVSSAFFKFLKRVLRSSLILARILSPRFSYALRKNSCLLRACYWH